MKPLILLLALSALPLPLKGADVFVRDGDSGSGAAWNDALDDLPGTLTRGNTYWIADGNYAGYTFDDAESGTALITVKKATTAEHGTETGWVSTYGDGQAEFTGSLKFTSDYWLIDGSTRNENSWTDVASYGFRCAQGVQMNSSSFGVGNNVTVQYIDLGSTYDEAPSDATIDNYSESVYLGFSGIDNFTLSRSHCHNGTPALFQNAGATNVLIEYCQFSHGYGKEAIRGQNTADGMIIRWSRFWNSTQKDPNDPTSGATAEIGCWSGTHDNMEVYGNFIYNTKTIFHSDAVILIGGNGGSWPGVGTNNTKVYNNTIAGIKDGQVNIQINGGSNNEAKNNLGYDNHTNVGIGGSPAVATNVNATSDPFVNYAGADFRINSGSEAHDIGTNLGGSPYNLDPLGVARGQGGGWDVGAYEFDEGTPSLSTAVIPTGGTTIVFTYSESVSIGAGGNAGFTMSMSGGAVTATYSSGAPGTALTYNLSRTVNTGETGTHDYTQPGNGIEATDDAADVATYTGTSVTNNSTQGGGGGGSTLTISGTLTIGP